MVPTQAGDGNYGYAEFIGNTSGGDGEVIIGAGDSDGGDFFNLSITPDKVLFNNETIDIFDITASGAKLANGKELTFQAASGSTDIPGTLFSSAAQAMKCNESGRTLANCGAVTHRALAHKIWNSAILTRPDYS